MLTLLPTTFRQDNCNPPSPAPSNYRAFNLGNCQAQLTFSRGKNVGVQWEFDAIYPDGSRVNHKPFRNFSNIAVSDTFYTLGYGNNYLTNRTQSQAFTSVHELSNVCRNGVVPSAWIFYTTTEGACNPKGYRYTTGRINAVTGSRPAKTNFSARQINSAGEVEVTWNAVSNAQSYNVFIQIPTSEYEGGNGYFTTDRGARVAVSSQLSQCVLQSNSRQSSITRAILPGITRFRNPEEPRKVCAVTAFSLMLENDS